LDLILVVCGAGASSTFLASRIRKLAEQRALDVTARAASNLDLDSRLADARVLLVGPHLEPSFAEIAASAAVHSVPAVLLPTDAFGPDGAANALDTALALLSPTSEGSSHA
jgi:PTS system cellobiose-specific IIB component